MPQADPDDYVDPDLPAHDDDVALDTTVTLLTEAARLRDEVDGLHAELDQARRDLDDARAGAVLRAKRRFVRAADDNRAMRGLLKFYRKARGR